MENKINKEICHERTGNSDLSYSQLTLEKSRINLSSNAVESSFQLFDEIADTNVTEQRSLSTGENRWKSTIKQRRCVQVFNVIYAMLSSRRSFFKKLFFRMYKKQHHLVIPFLFGIIVGCCLTTLAFQQHLLLGGFESLSSMNLDFNVKNMNSVAVIIDSRKEIGHVNVKEKPQVVNARMSRTSSDNILKQVQFSSKMKSRLYVGVITAEKFLASRALGVNNTWGQEVDKIEFFAQHGSSTKFGIPVVNLVHSSDREYPPQKKAFEMLKYMCTRHIDDFEWFVRADDDVYIRVELLRKLLTNIDSNRMIYMGQPGHGITEVRSRLGLNGHNFCMGGPGVIFSRKALKALCPHIDACMEEVVSREEDVEIGRCVTNHLQIECTHAWKTLKLFYHAYQEEYREERPFLGDLYENEHVHQALTLHHLKIPTIMYRVHRHYTGLKLRAIAQNLTDLQAELDELHFKFPAFRSHVMKWQRSVWEPSKAKRMEDVQPWKTFTTQNLYSLHPIDSVRDVTDDVFADLKQVGEDGIDRVINISTLHQFAFSHVIDGSIRSDFGRGTDYYVDVHFNGKQVQEKGEIRRVHLHRPRGLLKLSGMTKSTISNEDDGQVAVVIAVNTSKPNDLQVFMRNFYEPLFLARGQSSSAVLVVAPFGKPALDKKSLHPPADEVLSWYRDRYPGANLVSLSLPDEEDDRSVGSAYTHGVSRADELIRSIRVDPETVLLLLTIPDVALAADVTRVCRIRTFSSTTSTSNGSISHHQLYQPVPFHFYPTAGMGPLPTAMVPQGAGLKPGRGAVPASMAQSNTGFWDVNFAGEQVVAPLCGRLKDFLTLARAALESKGGVDKNFSALLFSQVYSGNLTINRIPDRSYSNLPP